MFVYNTLKVNFVEMIKGKQLWFCLQYKMQRPYSLKENFKFRGQQKNNYMKEEYDSWSFSNVEKL